MKLDSIGEPKSRLRLGWTAVVVAALACSPASLLAPTPTPTPTATPTSTATPTPRPTATPTLTPTVLPTSIEAPEPQALLRLEDLPDGFESVPPAEFGLEEGQTFAEGITIGDAFAYIEPNRFEVIFGFTMALPQRLDQVGFDAGLERPEVLIDGLVAGMGSTEYRDVEVLEGVDQIGDKSSGIGLVVVSDPIALQMDMLIFRKGALGAFLVLMYFEGEQPLTSVLGLAETMAGRAGSE